MPFDATGQGLESGLRGLGANMREARQRRDEEEKARIKRQNEKYEASARGVDPDLVEKVGEGALSLDGAVAIAANRKAEKAAQLQSEAQMRTAAIESDPIAGPLAKGGFPQADIPMAAKEIATSATPYKTREAYLEPYTKKKEDVAKDAETEAKKKTTESEKAAFATGKMDPVTAYSKGIITYDQYQEKTGQKAPKEEDKPTRTQVVAAQFDKNDPELRKQVAAQVVQQIGDFSKWMVQRTAGAVTPDQVMQANARGDTSFDAEYGQEYSKIVNEEIDKSIEYLKTQALGGTPVEMPNPALEARGRALDAAYSDTEKMLADLMKELQSLKR